MQFLMPHILVIKLNIISWVGLHFICQKPLKNCSKMRVLSCRQLKKICLQKYVWYIVFSIIKLYNAKIYHINDPRMVITGRRRPVNFAWAAHLYLLLIRRLVKFRQVSFYKGK